MNFKNVLIGSAVGFIVNFLLGWLFYGILFPELHPHSESTNMLFIALGCFFTAMMLAYIFDQMSQVNNWMSGFKIAMMISAISAISMLFFMYSSMPFDSSSFVKEFIASVLSGGITGAAIAIVKGKMS